MQVFLEYLRAIVDKWDMQNNKKHIRPVRNHDTKKTVYLWQVYRATKLAGGGYCSTQADAKSAAAIFARSLSYLFPTMKQTVNSSDFVDAFRTHNRLDQYSHEGLKALFGHLEQYEEDTGCEMELDVIAICCDFSEHATATEAATEHGWEADAEADEDGNEEAALAWLTDRTQVIPHAEGIIIQSF